MPGRAGGTRLRGGILTMKGRDITEQIRQAGYEVALSEDWQKVRCTGPKALPEAYKDLLKANKHEVLHWLVANAFKDHLKGRIIDSEEAGVAVRMTYLATDRNLQDDWLKSAGSIIRKRDDKGRLDATFSEIESCIIGVRSDPRKEAKTLLQRLKDSIPEAKKCSSRLKAQYKRKRRKTE